MRIEEEIIEQVRKASDIVDVVGEYVQLKKSGRNYFGLCPFHQEHTPSFSVSPDKQIFHCFGCGMGGNVFSFIQEIEGMSFPESVQHLGDKVNIAIQGIGESQVENKKKDQLGSLYHGMELLTKFFHYLLTETAYGKPALDYLEKRGLSKETIKHFQIGYAANDWHTQSNFLKRRELPLELFEQVGMVAKRSFDGKWYDRFRNRIMFPIWDTRGRPVAFAGRVLDDQKPKYLNTPESSIFHKGRLLYGYHSARQTIKQKNEVVLFEGYMDVIKAFQVGVKNGIASMGTSLTEEQAGILTRGAEKIIISYDSDQAGVDAAFRAASILEKYGRSVKIAQMSDGLDPDEYISRFGGDRFRQDVLGASLTVTAFKIMYLRKGRNLSDEADRLKYIEEVLNLLSDLPKAVERDHYLRQLADEFSLSLEALKQQQYQLFRRKKRSKQTDETRPTSVQRLKKTPHLLPAHIMAERYLIVHMMRDEDIARRVREQVGGAFYDEINQAIIAYLYAFYEEGFEADVGSFIQRLPEEGLRDHVTELAMLDIDEEADDQVIEDYMNQVLKHQKVLEIEKKMKLKTIAEQNQDIETATHLLAEIIQMKNQLQKSH